MSGKANWLEQVGVDILKGAKAMLGTSGSTIENIVTAPSTIVSDIRKMVTVIKDVEVFANGLKAQGISNIDKLALAGPNMAQLVLDAEFLIGNEIGDPDLFNKAVQEYSQATVDLAKSLKPKPAVAVGTTPLTSAKPKPAPAPVPLPLAQTSQDMPED